jgi:hypothetical protein
MNSRWFKIKAILINCGIAAALMYRYWTGTPMLIVVIVGAILFAFANFLMLLSAKQQTNRNS